MFRKSNKNFISRFLFNSKTFAFIGLVIIVLISIPLAKVTSQRYKVDQEIKELEQEIIDLEKKNIDLKEFIDYLESNQFIEEQARLQFGLKKESEEVAVIKINGSEQNIDQDKTEDKAAPATVGSDKKQTANLQRWLKYFFKRF